MSYKTLNTTLQILSSRGGLEVEQWSENRTLSISVDQSPLWALNIVSLDCDISVVSIEFSPLSTIELTTNWYQLHNGDNKGILYITDIT